MVNTLKILLFTIFLVSRILLAQEQELIVVQKDSQLVKVTADLRWNTLTIRLVSKGKSRAMLKQQELLQILDTLVIQKGQFLKEHEFNSIFLGRLIEYPWLEKFLILQAAQSADWDPVKGHLKNRKIFINSWVASQLFRHPIFKTISKKFQKIHYRLTKVSVEKVLVTGLKKIGLKISNIQKGNFPFDAQVWLILKKQKLVR